MDSLFRGLWQQRAHRLGRTSNSGYQLTSFAWAFGPPIGMKIASSRERLGSNRRGTAKTGPTLDQLRPLTSLDWDACFEPICYRVHGEPGAAAGAQDRSIDGRHLGNADRCFSPCLHMWLRAPTRAAAFQRTSNPTTTVNAMPTIFLQSDNQDGGPESGQNSSALQFVNSSIFSKDGFGVRVLRDYTSGDVLASSAAGLG